MDISKSNFAASVNEIVSLIERSSFAAIDLEMTGISSPSLPEHPLCRPEEAYLAKRDAAKRYNIIQVGLCLFEEQQSEMANSASNDAADDISSSSSDTAAGEHKPSFLFPSKSSSSSSSLTGKMPSISTSTSTTAPLRLVARPFNFFVFPAGAPGGSSDLSAVFPPRDVTISADAASFLRAHGMDWSRWINTGVSYCNRIEMIRARDQMWKRRDEERAAAPRVAREARAALTEQQKQWVDSAVVQAAGFAADAADKPAGTDCVLPPIRNTASCVALRAAINADPQLAALLAVSFRGRRHFHDAILVRRALSPEEETSKMVLDAVGFSTVFQALLAQRRPIIGHNCFADWCFMMESFFEPLPPTLPMFKQMMRTAAPAVYDTKVLATGGAFSGPDEGCLIPPSLFESTHLEGLFRAFGGLRSANVVNSIDGSSSSSSSNTGAKGGKNNNGGKKRDSNNTGGAAAISQSNHNHNQLLEISLPLGFTNYDASAGKSSAAHEAGFDALMTGTIFGHFLARFASTPLLDAAENKLALFRSMYAVDLAATASDSRNSVKTSPLPKGTEKQSAGTSAVSSADVFLPGRHELLHIKHGLGNNASPVEHALRTAVENVSFFFNLGDGEVLACVGSGPTEGKGDLGAPVSNTTTSSSSEKDTTVVQQQQQQRPKAVTVAQLNERITAEQQQAKQATDAAAAAAIKKFTDSAALLTLKSTTCTHILPPHLQWPSNEEEQQQQQQQEGESKYASKIQPVPAGAKGSFSAAVQSRFTVTQFRDRDFRALFKAAVMRRK